MLEKGKCSKPIADQDGAHPTVQCHWGLDERLQNRFTYAGDRIPEYCHCIFRISYEEVQKGPDHTASFYSIEWVSFIVLPNGL